MALPADAPRRELSGAPCNRATPIAPRAQAHAKPSQGATGLAEKSPRRCPRTPPPEGAERMRPAIGRRWSPPRFEFGSLMFAVLVLLHCLLLPLILLLRLLLFVFLHLECNELCA